jgi:hypothetical protein
LVDDQALQVKIIPEPLQLIDATEASANNDSIE